MKELVRMIAQSLVSEPEEVVVTETETEEGLTVILQVAPDDMGKIIGKKGRTAKAIRTVVNAAASKEDKHVNIEIQQ